MIIKAELKNYRQSPRKVRLVADLVRGKKVGRAFAELNFLNKRASEAMTKLVNSAVANAKNNFGIEKENLIIQEIRVDDGPTLKRFRPRARGSASRINKRTCRILVILSDGKVVGGKVEKAKAKTKTNVEIKKIKEKKEVKKTKK